MTPLVKRSLENGPTDSVQFGWINLNPSVTVYGVGGYVITVPSAAVLPHPAQALTVEDEDLRIMYSVELAVIQRLAREILGADTIVDATVADGDSPDARIVVRIGYRPTEDSVAAVVRLYGAVATNTSRGRLQRIVLLPEPVSADRAGYDPYVRE